jgi:hypothetical protein
VVDGAEIRNLCLGLPVPGTNLTCDHLGEQPTDTEPIMRSLALLAIAALTVAPNLTVPVLAIAQPYAAYGPYDPCVTAKRAAGANGAVTGGALGAVIGSAIAGRGSRFGGAIVGGTVGAVAGHEIGRNSVRCLAYPHRSQPRAHCRWVEQDWRGRPHQFELCRAPNGVWRPSGRRLY